MNRSAKHSLTLGVSDSVLSALACVVICKAREHDFTRPEIIAEVRYACGV